MSTIAWWRRGATKDEDMLRETWQLMLERVEAFARTQADPVVALDQCWAIAGMVDDAFHDGLPTDPPKRADALCEAVFGCTAWGHPPVHANTFVIGDGEKDPANFYPSGAARSHPLRFAPGYTQSIADLDGNIVASRAFSTADVEEANRQIECHATPAKRQLHVGATGGTLIGLVTPCEPCDCGFVLPDNQAPTHTLYVADHKASLQCNPCGKWTVL